MIFYHDRQDIHIDPRMVIALIEQGINTAPEMIRVLAPDARWSEREVLLQRIRNICRKTPWIQEDGIKIVKRPGISGNNKCVAYKLTAGEEMLIKIVDPTEEGSDLLTSLNSWNDVAEFRKLYGERICEKLYELEEGQTLSFKCVWKPMEGTE